MRLVRPSLAAVTVTLLTASMLAAAPAVARPATERDSHHFPTSLTTTVPAGGSSTVTTPTLGSETEKVKVTVAPQSGASAQEKDSVDDLTHVLGTMSKGERLLLCVMLHQIVAAMGYGDNIEFRLNAADSALTMLGACLRLAGLIAQDKGAPAARTAPPARAGRACDSVKPSVPATLEKVDDGYELTVDGKVKRTQNPRLRIGCQVKGSRLIYKVRAAKKGVPLRRVVGKRLSIGMQSPSDAETGAPVRVTFATP